MPQHFTLEELEKLEEILNQPRELSPHDGAFPRIAAELKRLWEFESSIPPLYQIDREGNLKMVCPDCDKEHKQSTSYSDKR